ncbi:MAG: flagellar export chaperone FliS [bacterium]
MTYAAATSAYRDMEVLSATPGKLVVIVYDFLLVNLRRTGIAIDTANAELFSVSVGKSQDAIAELMGGLDMERGGKIANDLCALYAFFLSSLIDVVRTKDRRLLTRITAQVTDLRDAFAHIANTNIASAA